MEAQMGAKACAEPPRATSQVKVDREDTSVLLRALSREHLSALAEGDMPRAGRVLLLLQRTCRAQDGITALEGMVAP